jgi:exodeoxyribonuclease V beta subunit
MMDLNAWEMPLSGTSLIEASAGTGKTYTLTTLYLRLLVEQELLPSQILVVTYTQAATSELRERVRGRIVQSIEAQGLGSPGTDAEEEDAESRALRELAELARIRAAESGRPDALRRALQEFDEAAIFTIHGFCQRTLQENAFESGLAFDAQLVEQPDQLERTLAQDLWTRLLGAEDPSFVAWLVEGSGQRWQFEPDALRRDVLGEIGADENMPVVPPLDVDAESLDMAVLRMRVAGGLRAWLAAWGEHRESFAGALLSKNDLKQNTHKAATIESRWLPDLDRLARRIAVRMQARNEAVGEGGEAAVALPDFFEKLTTHGLEKGTKKGGIPIEDPVLPAFDEVFDSVQALEGANERRALNLRRRFVEASKQEARRRREERHLLFFDDLLSELRKAVLGEAGGRLTELLRERYPFALIDEFQDTDPVQYDIFHHVWHAGPIRDRPNGLVLIGDPKQAIYSFRGADVFTYLSARKDAGEQAYGLPTNWRSEPALIKGVNQIFRSRLDPFQISAIDFHPVGPRPGYVSEFNVPGRSAAGIRVLMADRTQAADFVEEEVAPEKPLPIRFGRTVLMQAVARDIADLLDSGASVEGRPLLPSDIAVLCRRKSELAQMRRALEDLGIPCADRGDEDVFESREAWELLSVLGAMMRSGDPSTLRGALSTGAHGLGARALVDLSDESLALAEISERFAEYGRVWSQSGFGRAFETWRRAEGVTERLLAYQDGERRLTNWLHLAELLQRVASERSPSRSSLVNWLERSIASEESRAVVGSEASLLRLERDDHAVSLVTLHRSKGLEYPIVILPSLWEDTSRRGPSAESAAGGKKQNPPVRFHDSETGQRTLDLAGHDGYADHLGLASEEAFSEQLRLLYVGLTRAKYQCVIAWGAIGKAYAKSPLAWLLHGPEAEAEGLDRTKSAAAMKKWKDEDWAEAWGRIAEQAGEGAVAVEAARYDGRKRWQEPDRAAPNLVLAESSRRFERPNRTTSFSGLAREGHRARGLSTGAEVTGRDVDAELPVLGSVHEAVGGGSDLEVVPDLDGEMHTFPRGADAGTLLHEVLEHVEFGRTPEDEVRRRALETLIRNGLDVAHVDQVLHVVESVAETPLRLAPESFRISDLGPGQLRPEIEFTLVTQGDETSLGLTAEKLGALLSKAPDGSPAKRYAERASRMGFQPLKGFLRGFIDATFYDGERYYLVDYKSNFLGARQADYQPSALVEPMIEHDYVLQYLIYSVALHRHLERRLSNYNYDEHFGGAYYLFLRGLSKKHTPGCGVFFDRPERSLIEELSAAMGSAMEAQR